MSACNLCSDLQSPTPVKAWNKSLFESQNFVALPSLGALVEGWVLLVPKRHFISFGAMPDSVLAEMSDFKSFVCSVLGQCYGTLGAFEHGPSAASRTMGCGVDHAHLHLVPCQFDLLNEVTPYLPRGVTWTNAGIEECQAAYRRGEDYLYLEQPIGSARIATHDRFGSQLFRRAIATRIGVWDQYNWRDHEQLTTVMATIERVRAWASIGVFEGESDLVA